MPNINLQFSTPAEKMNHKCIDGVDIYIKNIFYYLIVLVYYRY